jgi:hypothetical protein
MHQLNLTVAQTYCYLPTDSTMAPETLSAVEAAFETLRQSGVKALLRFAYDRNMPGTENYTADTVLGHISQLANVVQSNADALYVLQVRAMKCLLACACACMCAAWARCRRLGRVTVCAAKQVMQSAPPFLLSRPQLSTQKRALIRLNVCMHVRYGHGHAHTHARLHARTHTMQAGFLGSWGEWHSSLHDLSENSTITSAVVEAELFTLLPPDRRINVRVPVCPLARAPRKRTL